MQITWEMQHTMKKEVNYNLIVQSCPPLTFQETYSSSLLSKALGPGVLSDAELQLGMW